MAIVRSIDFHLSCQRCGYDVYALPAHGGCPECGQSIMLSICDVAFRARGMWSVLAQDAIGKLARRIGRRSAEVEFVWHAHCFVMECGRQGDDVPRDPKRFRVKPVELCRAVRELARLAFGAAAGEQLEAMRLATRLQLAALVEAMAQRGLFRLASGSTVDEFLDAGCPELVG